MNFLAHIYLSGPFSELTVGNYLGDFVKGSDFSSFSVDFAKGVRLHRAIDAYTDSHPVYKKSAALLHPHLARYSPVALDIFYDHFLAKNWSRYSAISLEEYSNSFYAFAGSYLDIFPEKAKYMFSYMSRHNWLLGYAYLEGIDKALQGMSRRTRFESGLEKGVAYLKLHYTALENDFDQFFPDLQAHVKRVT